MTKEIIFKLDESQIEFIECHKSYGFKDESELLASALKILQSELEADQLKKSAELYAEIYQEDRELQDITKLGLAEWPKE